MIDEEMIMRLSVLLESFHDFIYDSAISGLQHEIFTTNDEPWGILSVSTPPDLKSSSARSC
jgi:hypothetical protein